MIIIDSDGGVDDALAIAAAIHWLGSEIRLISAGYGNVSAKQAATNIATLLDLLGGTTPVAIGAEKSLDGFFADATYVHGKDGMGGTIGSLSTNMFIPLSDWLSSNRPSLDSRVRVLGIGPATNVLSIVCGLGVENIESVTMMSGVLFDRGNITPVAEFNAYSDPLALSLLLSLDVPLKLVPLDLCRKVQVRKEDLAAFSCFGPVADILTRAHEHYMKSYFTWEGVDGCYPHDFLTLLVMIRPDMFDHYDFNVRVSDHPDHRGEMIIDELGGRKASIVLGGNLKWARDLFRNGFRLD